MSSVPIVAGRHRAFRQDHREPAVSNNRLHSRQVALAIVTEEGIVMWLQLLQQRYERVLSAKP
jgi:hypothetical protein